MIILTKTPLWILGILAALLTLIAMSGPLLVRKRISLERLSTNNEVAGFKFATIGVIYARGAAVMAELLRQLDLLGHARRARLVIAAGIVPNVVWDNFNIAGHHCDRSSICGIDKR